jgi:O-antigen ligase
MANRSITTRFDRTRLSRNADWLAVAVAVSLPWSTSATGILAVLWLLALIPALDWTDLRHQLLTPAGGLPAVLFALGALGMLWADVSWIERWHGIDSFFKLLAMPLLLAQFLNSKRGLWVLGGYLAACMALLAGSAILSVWPSLVSPDHIFGVPVKNEATQSGEFVTCIFGLLYLAVDNYEHRRPPWLIGLPVLVALGMAADIFYVATGRTALVIISVLLVLFAIRKLRAGGIVILFAGAILVGATGWMSSPYLRNRAIDVWREIQSYEASDATNSSGERIEFWKKSLAFVREAPIIGHGTGSMHELFTKSAIGQTGPAASATTNPHNQTFAVAIQVGLIGAVILWAMWIAHLMLFRGSGLAEWIGLVVVVQNIVGSLFNSHLFDFVQGWVYVFGVGVAGGMVLKRRSQKANAGGAGPSA